MITEPPPPGPWIVTRTEDTNEVTMTFNGGWLVKRRVYVLSYEYTAITATQAAAEAVARALNSG